VQVLCVSFQRASIIMLRSVPVHEFDPFAVSRAQLISRSTSRKTFPQFISTCLSWSVRITSKVLYVATLPTPSSRSPRRADLIIRVTIGSKLIL
jgi:hypothetical protein